MQRSTDNPFSYHGDLLDLEQEESIDDVMRGIQEVNRARWQFVTWYQILFLPLTLMVDKIENYFEAKRRRPFLDIDSELFFPIERRKDENAWLRQMFNAAKGRVHHHMMPKTLKVERIDRVA